MMIMKAFTIFASLSIFLAAPPPKPIYDSYGPNQLLKIEGKSITTVNGNEALYGVSPDQCAGVCHLMERQCTCCNSFSYQPKSGTCYLKKRSKSASNKIVYSVDGWQSYKYYGLSHPAFGYTGDLPETAFGFSVGVPVEFAYAKSFVGKGPNQLAKFEGYPLKTSQGKNSLTGVESKKCAEECLKTSNCDGFSYNPKQAGGKCFLKRNSSSGKYQTAYSSQGWTFYWLEDGVDKCYCTCKSSFVCVTCYSNGKCDAF